MTDKPDWKFEILDDEEIPTLKKIEFTGDEMCYEAPRELTSEEQERAKEVDKQIKEFEATLPVGVRYKSMQFMSQGGWLTDAQAITGDGIHYSDKTPEERKAHNKREREKMIQWQAREDNVYRYGFLYSPRLRVKLILRKIKQWFRLKGRE